MNEAPLDANLRNVPTQARSRERLRWRLVRLQRRSPTRFPISSDVPVTSRLNWSAPMAPPFPSTSRRAR